VAAARDRDAVERVDPSLVFGAATAVARPDAKGPVPASAPRPQAPVVRAPDAWARLDRPLAAAWLALAAVALARLVVVAVQGRRVVRRWPRRVVHGAPVRVSGDVGPAVAGALRPQVVLPAWALDDPRLPVMLAHERAHVRAGDPLLLAAARAAAALLPWHPAVWWQLRRLRAAVEVDCDRRVLRARAADARAYGALLLDVAARPTAALPVLAMASSPTLLRRRIDVITTRRPAHALLRAAAPATLAAALVALACETPRPTGPRPVARVPLTQVVPAADAVPEGHVSAADVRDVLAAHAPDLLQTGHRRSRRLWVVQEADGRVSRVEHGLEADLVQPVHELRASRITPGANGTARVTTQGATRELVAVTRPGAIATVEPSRIAAMEVMRLAPGRVTPDGLHVIWLRLRAAVRPAPRPSSCRRSHPRPCPERAGRPRPGGPATGSPSATRGARSTRCRSTPLPRRRGRWRCASLPTRRATARHCTSSTVVSSPESRDRARPTTRWRRSRRTASSESASSRARARDTSTVPPAPTGWSRSRPRPERRQRRRLRRRAAVAGLLATGHVAQGEARGNSPFPRAFAWA
jgi:hypothetical protein